MEFKLDYSRSIESYVKSLPSIREAVDILVYDNPDDNAEKYMLARAVVATSSWHVMYYSDSKVPRLEVRGLVSPFVVLNGVFTNDSIVRANVLDFWGNSPREKSHKSKFYFDLDYAVRGIEEVWGNKAEYESVKDDGLDVISAIFRKDFRVLS